ncbi:globin [uncultured Gimesia sp.]|uniref:globin domain-containing protein n=1 Tax=uncultured Gimesia sp. TaxID=1678688 RepID=UPI0030D87478|tara:strand:+ start:24133 stop:24519 length:387 start_codon:yes stop_codon:yes gene_type:complete
MSQITVEEIYDHLGEEKLQQLIAAFYQRVKTDDILNPMYPADDLKGAEYRLKEFLVYRLGGPQRYLDERGNPALRMRHAPFAINQSARDRWMELMKSAMDETELPADVRQALESFFDQIATFLINQAS